MTAATSIILAKSTRCPSAPLPHETLMGHSSAVADSFQALFLPDGKTGWLTEQWFTFFQLSQQDHDIFLQHGLAAAWLHDLGKANNTFQAMLRHKSPGDGLNQALYHEFLSGMILSMPEADIFFPQSLNRELLITAVMSHHLRFDRSKFAELGFHDTFQINVPVIESLLNRAFPPPPGSPSLSLSLSKHWSFYEQPGICQVYKIADALKYRLEKYHWRLRNDKEEVRLLRALRAALIISDSAGSGITRENKEVRDWLPPLFSKDQCLSEQEIFDSVITPRINSITKKRSFSFQWSGFQEKAAKLPDRALLITPCGSGKTLAAWRWIAARLSDRPASRVIFLYPTRATAAEGFRDYVSWAPESDAALISGSATFDLEGMFDNASDDRRGRSYLTEERLFALGYWPRRIFSATVDQFMGFTQNVYASICLLPLLADSVLVLDEIHSYDKGLFDALKAFLKEFNLPVLCMTASLPGDRICELTEESGLRLFPDPVHRADEHFPDLQERSDKERYKVTLLPGEDEALKNARQALDQGLKVLWVINTTERCRRLAKKMKALCYHSRFRLCDRKKQHDRVIRAFQGEKQAVCAVTTQVCEMSLDLDADVLISEYAPITALIQRMGRCNRRDLPQSNRIGEVFLYKPENDLPYDKKSLSGVTSFVSALTEGLVTQKDLAELLGQLGPDQYEAERWLSFINGGVNALSREESLRDGIDFLVQAVLDSDVSAYLELRKQRSPKSAGLLLPVPRQEGKRDGRLPDWLHIASSENYDPNLGYSPQTRKEIL